MKDLVPAPTAKIMKTLLFLLFDVRASAQRVRGNDQKVENSSDVIL